MRPGQGKRSRGRNGGGNNPHHNNNNNNRRPGGMPQRIQTFDSNGPAVKIRGNAYQVFERYIAMAREAQASGDRISAENLYQHAEHYFRVMNAQGEGGFNQGQPRPTTPADTEMAPGDGEQPEIPAEDGQMQHAQMQQAQAQHAQAQHAQVEHAQVQHAPEPPAPPPDDDHLPAFLTGRSE